MVFPNSLRFFIPFLMLGFLLSAAILTSRQKRELMYQKLAADDCPEGSPPTRLQSERAVSYQNAGRADYAIPQSQKVVTYCVIDDRLIDK